MTPQHALNQLLSKQDLAHEDMLALMRQIMQGEVSPVHLSALLVALRAKKESVSEIAAGAQVMRELVAKVNVNAAENLIDVVGTGGDSSHTFNISTTVMFVASAAGAKVAKHGGRSVSSNSGAADVLEALEVNLNLTPEGVAQAIEQIGVGFMFAPNHHQAMKHAAPIRRELGVRTIFNILGPLTNPANAKRQLLGVYSPDLVQTLAQVLNILGSTHALVVHGENGMDEISPCGKTIVAELRDGLVREYEIHPEDFGLPIHSLESLKVADAHASKTMLLGVLQGIQGAARDTVVLNAAAALYVAGVAPSLRDGILHAQQAIDSGLALKKLQTYAQFTQQINQS